MADKKISALTGATTPLAGTEVLPIVQGSATVKVSVANLTAGRAVATAGGSFTDNVTQSTAAKGINFTANTPAAGMTSQLLNWYEEGDWTPNQGAGLTVVGAFSSGGKYVRVGKTVTVNFYVSGATSIAAAAGDFITTNLPFTASGAGAVGISTNASPSVTIAVLLPASTTNVISAGVIGATATIYVSATYSV